MHESEMCFPSFDFSLNISNSSLNLLTKVFHEFRMHKTVLKALHSPSPGLTPLELWLFVCPILLTTPFKFHFWILSFISHSPFPLSTLPGTIINFCLDNCDGFLLGVPTLIFTSLCFPDLFLGLRNGSAQFSTFLLN